MLEQVSKESRQGGILGGNFKVCLLYLSGYIKNYAAFYHQKMIRKY